MKSAWNAVSFVAVVNLIAVLVLAGWLWRSDRLDRDRILAIRALLGPTIAESRAAAQAAEDADARRRQDGAATEEVHEPPLPSDAQIARASLVADRTSQAVRRVRDESERQRSELARRLAELEASEASFAARRQAWEESIAVEARQREDEQFAKTVALYEALAGKPAKQMLLELVRQQNGDLDQAVAYIDAMSIRAAAKTLKELKTESENELATRLLERLRTLGIDAEAAELASDDPTSDRSD